MILLNGKEVEFGTFPNGETIFKKDGLEIATLIPNEISFKYENDSDLIKLMFLKNYLDLKGTVNGLIIYYMPYSRNDRSVDGSPFTLKYIADFINNLKFDSIDIIEPHSDVSMALINKSNSIHINAKLLPKVLEEIGFNTEYDYIVYPDATSNRRYSGLLDCKSLTGLKHRDFATGKITELELAGKFEKSTINNQKALLIDDLSSYGGTFLLTAEKLVELGFGEIYLLVGHAEDSIFKGGLLKSGLIDKVFTTDTILTEHKENWCTAIYKDKLKVYNIEEVLADA